MVSEDAQRYRAGVRGVQVVSESAKKHTVVVNGSVVYTSTKLSRAVKRAKSEEAKVSKGVFQWFTSIHALERVNSILHLPFWKRIVHVAARRTFGLMALGCGLMLAGSGIASSGHQLGEMFGANPLLFDTAGYFLHGVGAVPILRHIEPLIALLAGE